MEGEYLLYTDTLQASEAGIPHRVSFGAVLSFVHKHKTILYTVKPLLYQALLIQCLRIASLQS